MPPSSLTCTTCCVSRGRKAFLRRYKQRVLIDSVCISCRTAALLKDSTGRAIQRALARGKITDPEARALRATLEQMKTQRESERRAKLSANATRMWEERRDAEARFGVRVPTIREAERFLSDPDARLAFEREQADKRAAYQNYLRSERERRKKISATLTGRKRGPYLKAKDRI